jgi:hypothetical protein
MKHIVNFNLSYFEYKYPKFKDLSKEEKERLIHEEFEEIHNVLLSNKENTLFTYNENINVFEVQDNDTFSIELRDVNNLKNAKEHLFERASYIKNIPKDLAKFQKYISITEVISIFDLLIEGSFDKFFDEYSKIKPNR